LLPSVARIAALTENGASGKSSVGGAMPNGQSAITEEHIKRFQDRARFHSAISYSVLVGIIALFVFAIYIFLFAQEIDRSKGSIQVLQELQIAKADQALVLKAAEASAKLATERLQQGTIDVPALQDILRGVGEARVKLRLFEEQLRLMNQLGYVADLERPRSKEEFTVIAAANKQQYDDLQKIRDIMADREQAGTASQLDVTSIERVVGETKLQQDLFENRAQAAQPAAALKTVSTNLDTIELVRTSLVRFGGVTVILFLASLLTPIYRYNVRLATFYQARADALVLSRDTHVNNFSEMIRILTPIYGFEKEPTTPVQSMASLLKEAGGIIKKV